MTPLETAPTEVMRIETENIRPDPNQPRRDFDEKKLEELARSMKEQGQAVPITVRPGEGRPGEGRGGGGSPPEEEVPGENLSEESAGGLGAEGSRQKKDEEYVLIAGERRWRAAQRLGWDTVKAEVRDVGPKQARWLALTENLQREDLSAVEEARAFQRQLRREKITQAELAEKVGKSQSYVAQKLRLLSAPTPVSFWTEEGLLSEAHLRQLLRLEGFFLEGARREFSEEILPKEDLPEETLSEETLPKEAVRIESFAEAQRLVNRSRPTDYPPLFLDMASSGEKEALGEERKTLGGEKEILCRAASCLLRHACEQDLSPKSWVVAAWSLAAFAWGSGLSARELAQAVSSAEEQLRSHLVYFGLHHPPWMEAAPPHPRPDATGRVPPERLTEKEARQASRRLFHRHGISDLRHAGMLQALRATCRERMSGKIESAGLPPSPATKLSLSAKQIGANESLITESIKEVTLGKKFIYPSAMATEEAPLTSRRKALEKRASEAGLPSET